MAQLARFTSEMLISHDSNETRVAILEDQRLVELYIERARRSVVGNVYLGKVRDVLPGMEAAFVDIGLEKNGFLYVDEVVAPEGLEGVPHRDIAKLLKPGQQVMVQVVRDPMGTKGARVTSEVSLPGRFLVLMPFSEFVGVSKKLPEEERTRLHELIKGLAPEGMGAIVRTAAAGVAERDIQNDLDFLLRLWRRVQTQAKEGLAPEVLYTEMDLALRMVRDVFGPAFKRLVIENRAVHEKVVTFLKKSSPELAKRVALHTDSVALFDYYSLQPQIEAATRRVVDLPSGGHISIDRTEALTAVDVNTGKFVGKRSLEDTILKTNLEAAEEAVLQLRLRDIGGIIVIDFIDMEIAENRSQVWARLATELQRDRTKTRVMEISKLGLVEMTRKNVTDGFWGVLTRTCPTCEGQGRVLTDATRRITAERRMREILRAGKHSAYLFGVHPEVYELLTVPGSSVLSQLGAESGKKITLLPDPDCSLVDVCVIIEGKSGA